MTNPEINLVIWTAIDILLVAGAVYLIFRFVKRRR